VKAPADGRTEFQASDPTFLKLAVMQALSAPSPSSLR